MNAHFCSSSVNKLQMQLSTKPTSSYQLYHYTTLKSLHIVYYISKFILNNTVYQNWKYNSFEKTDFEFLHNRLRPS